MPIRNVWWKIAAAVLAVLLLSAPSAVGVYKALEPTRGALAAGMAAAGFELAYLALSLLTLRPDLRQHARAVALGAVLTAIALNGLADYAHRVEGGLASWVEAQRLFDPLALALAIGESVPLAGLAYALASLLHRLAEQPAARQPKADDARWLGEQLQQPAAPAWAGPVLVAQPASYAREDFPAPVEVRAAPVQDAADRPAPSAAVVEAPFTASQPETPRKAHERTYQCKRCGAGPLSFAELGRHSRQCKDG